MAVFVLLMVVTRFNRYLREYRAEQGAGAPDRHQQVQRRLHRLHARHFQHAPAQAADEPDPGHDHPADLHGPVVLLLQAGRPLFRLFPPARGGLRRGPDPSSQLGLDRMVEDGGGEVLLRRTGGPFSAQLVHRRRVRGEEVHTGQQRGTLLSGHGAAGPVPAGTRSNGRSHRAGRRRLFRFHRGKKLPALTRNGGDPRYRCGARGQRARPRNHAAGAGTVRCRCPFRPSRPRRRTADSRRFSPLLRRADGLPAAGGQGHLGKGGRDEGLRPPARGQHRHSCLSRRCAAQEGSCGPWPCVSNPAATSGG